MPYTYNPFTDELDIVGSSSGGTGDPGGVDGDLQINAAGVFGTIAGLHLDQTGNTRGANSLDIQTQRSAVTQIAGGTGAIAVGYKLTAGSGAGVGNGVVVVGHDTSNGSTSGCSFSIGSTVTGTENMDFGHTNTVAGSLNGAYGIQIVIGSSAANFFAWGYNNNGNVTNGGILGNNIINTTANSIEIGTANTDKLQVSSSGINFVTAGSGQFKINGTVPYVTNPLSSTLNGNQQFVNAIGGLSFNAPNTGQPVPTLFFSGYDMLDTSTDTGGIAVGLGYNAAGNRQLWIGDSASLGDSGQTFFRYAFESGQPVQSAISGDGVTPMPFSIGDGSAILFLSTFPGSDQGTGAKTQFLNGLSGDFIVSAIGASGLNLDGSFFCDNSSIHSNGFGTLYVNGGSEVATLSTDNSAFPNGAGYIIGSDVPSNEADPIFSSWLGSLPFTFDIANNWIIVGDIKLDGGNNAITGLDHLNITTLTASKPVFTDSSKNIVSGSFDLPQIAGSGRATGQTAANTNVLTITAPATDTSYMVSANILVTAATLHSFTATVTYTDEGNTSRTVTLNFSTLAGALTPTIANAGGASPYEGVPLHIRAKASTTIVIKTAGTFTTVVYNVEGRIIQL